MESPFVKLRQELNDLGYTETLKPDCVPLVDRLFSDLKTTTENLQKYMKISQQAIEERDSLRLGAEPYKCDNAKLIRECNELHLAFIQFKEQHEKVQKDLKVKIVSLENQLQNCESEKQNLKKRIKDLDSGQLDKKAGVKAKGPIPRTVGKGKTFQLNSAMACAEEKIARLSNEIRKLKDDHLQLVESNEFFKTQLQNRNEEIVRLKSLLEGGRPTEAINRDCCYKNIDNKIGSLQDEISMLKREKNTLHNQLKEALAKQHEAMRRALHLAERNKQLEREMKDIDQIALAVEAECNSTVRNNVEKVTRMQDRINESVIIIQNLERENSKVKQDKLELCSELDAIKLEKKHLQTLLETEIDDKKRLTDRINSFTVIEHDLNMEIDRLVRLTGEQRKKIAELECQVTEGKVKYSTFEAQRPLVMPVDQPDYQYQVDDFVQTEDRPKSPLKSKKGDKTAKTKSAPAKKGAQKGTRKQSTSSKAGVDVRISENGDNSPPLVGNYGSYGSQAVRRCCCEAGSCVKHLRELLDREMDYRQSQAMQQIDSLKQEKEYYMKEYHKVCEELRNVPTQDRSDRLQQQNAELLRRMEEKDRMIANLQEEIRKLGREQFSKTSLRGMQRDEGDFEADEEICTKTACRRKARELEVLKNTLKDVEGENESLKRKIQNLTQSTVVDEEKIKRAFQEMEEHIRKLEDERRELVASQVTQRSSVTQLEEDHKMVREQLKSTQNELSVQKANYAQLKNLHDQTDRALSEAQSQLLRAETELASLQSRMNLSSRESATYEKEIAKLQGDVQVMKMQLSKLDKEKDDLLNVLDEKTEKIALLEDQLKDKRSTIGSLEMELRELKRKMGKLIDESASQEQLLRSSKQELAMTQQDYDTEKKLKECALNENRRLQNDLASISCECMDAKKQLDLSRRQVEDLKRQLQHYVAEVKRTEDLITQKELERAEILDQFRCLSEEAHVLESSNHTLESEATQSRVQLSVALDHASDLERKLENQESIIRSYEKQISELTSQVASLEIQMKQGEAEHNRVVTELKQMKDLCVRLDHDKDSLKRDIDDRENQRGQVTRSIDRLSRENDDLKRSLEKERNNLEGLEKLLNEARQEVIDQRLLNQDMQSEMTKLKTRVDELQERLDVCSRTQCPQAKYVPVQETPVLPKKDTSIQKPKSVCYKFCSKEKCPRASADLQKSYYGHCKRENCPVHRMENATKEATENRTSPRVAPILKKSSTKSDECKININTMGEYKYCSCGKPGIYCVCVQNKTKPPPANSKFVATYTHTFTTVKEKATSCSDFQGRNKSRTSNVPCLPCIQSSHNLAAKKRTGSRENKSKDVEMLMRSPCDMVSSSSCSESRTCKRLKCPGVDSPCGKCCPTRSKLYSRSSSDYN